MAALPPLRLQPLPYRRDSAAVFGRFAAEPWAVLLDSGVGGEAAGRYDILAARPRATLQTYGDLTEVRRDGDTRLSCDDPLELVREALGERHPQGSPLPFVGGAIGWLGYDLGRRFVRLDLGSVLPARAAQMAIGIYDWALVTDHRERRTWLTGRGSPGDPARQLLLDAVLGGQTGASEPVVAHDGFTVAGRLCSNMDADGYRARFDRVQALIRAGDCYQVNLARRFSAPARGDAWPVYRRLRAINPAPFSAYLHTPGTVVMSASPERFLHVRDGRVETKPIKGTTRRDPDPAVDRALAAALALSPKDRAENVMIVDLLRNDLGRCCVPGSVRVPRLLEVESFAGVHHLVSTVTGRLAPGQDALSLLRACFPGGSITGAPKRRTMQIIDALEGEPRGVYCGSIGYVGFDGAMDCNIAIRTLTFAEATLGFWAGGGLVADSRCDAEWAEIGIKARAMLAVAEHFDAAGSVASAAGAQLCGVRVR
ncbi:MAG: aminodeoxychorismate synthase component I [Thiohalocapsa sp.]|nr:aminodeoxychorismate synthase component I [Thiohalocapsa sp.]